MEPQDNIFDHLYEDRVLVLMEQDDKFQQITLNREQYKKLSDLISQPCDNEEHKTTEPYECRHLNFNEEWEIDADNFIGLSSIDEEIPS